MAWNGKAIARAEALEREWPPVDEKNYFVRQYLGGDDLLDKEKLLKKNLEKLECYGGARTEYGTSMFNGLKQSLVNLTEVIDLLGLRE